MKTRLRPGWVVAAPVLLAATSGCAALSPRGDYDRAAEHVVTAIGQPLTYRPEEQGLVAERVQALLQDGLTADEAVQLCLLNNAQLQAAFHEVGAARADFVQAGLFSNPTLTLAIRLPDGGGLANLEADLAQNIAELWQIPYRRAAAQHALERAVLELARRAAGLALDTKAAYYAAIGADRELALARDNSTLAQQLVDIALARRNAGSGNEIDVNLARSQELDTEVRLRAAAAGATIARADLARLLGLTTAPAELLLHDDLPDPSEWRLTVGDVVSVARDNRLDLRIAAETVGTALAQLDYQKTRFLREIQVGVSMERDARASRGDRKWLADAAWASLAAGQLTPPSFQPRERVATEWTVGPSISTEIPLFDQNQAQIARAQEEYEQARQILEALNRDLVQDAWQALERAAATRDTARLYATQVLPLREQSLNLAREAYRAGRVTLLSVLESQRDLLSGRAAYVQTLRDAALAMVALERLCGRPARELLATPPSQQPSNPDSPTPANPADDAEDHV